jgi:hypothetical protein
MAVEGVSVRLGAASIAVATSIGLVNSQSLTESVMSQGMKAAPMVAGKPM